MGQSRWMPSLRTEFFQIRRHEEKDNPKFNKIKNNIAMPFNSQGKTTKRFQCYKCGGTSHPKHECPANGAKCHSCGKMGHYQRVCLAGKAVHGIEEEESESFFLGSVSSDADSWTVDIGIMDKDVTFKLDSGADVTVVS